MNAGSLTVKHRYISFDVFDTLIKRSVAKPTDLFSLMEVHLAHVHPELPAGFALKRRTAELEGNMKAGRHIRLTEIYDGLRGEYGEYTNELMELEIQMELNGCRPNSKCVEWFDRCVADGKTVILISDMYLPSEMILQMLDKCGIRGYQKLYVSCECGAQKRDGSLFRVVLDNLKIHPKELLHIGDNRRSDFLTPLSMGIKALWIRNDQKRICQIPNSIKQEDELVYRTLKACIRNCSYGMNEYEKLGCEIFGPLLYGFTQWLADRLREDGITDVYFLARDGYMPMRAFEEFGISEIKTHYLYCSRRSYQVPMIWKHPDFDDVIRPFRYIKNMTLQSFISRIGLEANQYVEEAVSFGLQMDKIYEKGAIYFSSEVKDFYDLIKKDVVENSKREYESLVAYIKSMSFPKKIAVVDVGWHGSMQQALEELVHAEKLSVSVKGYYVGISTDACAIASGELDAVGYLHDTSRGEDLERDRLRSGAVFEAQFLAPHGSVRRFASVGNVIEPEFEPYEYAREQSQIIDEPVVIDAYQSGALALVRYIRDVFQTDTIVVTPIVAMYSFLRLVKHPTLKETRFWGDIRRFNFQKVLYCARPASFFRYIIHPRELKRDFQNADWKIGFMRRLFRIPLPYDKIVDSMKKLYYKF